MEKREKHLYNTMSDSLIAFTNEEYSVIEPLLNNLAAFSEEYPLLYSEMKKAWRTTDDMRNWKEVILPDKSDVAVARLGNFPH